MNETQKSIPSPKYVIGQIVYGSQFLSNGEHKIRCPDCLGALRWIAKLPNGEEFSIPCNTCERGYQCYGTITRYGPKVFIRKLTVGAVRIDTSDAESPVEYMCEETGIGSGTLWKERNLFSTEADADADGGKRIKEWANGENERLAKIEADSKKKSRHKPEWWSLKILALEKEIAELKAKGVKA